MLNKTEKLLALEELRKDQKKISEDFGVPVLPFTCNDRLRCCAARIFYLRTLRGPVPTKIEVSGPHLVTFGLESSLGYLRHEMAHQIAMVMSKNDSHNKEFKEICATIGGTMNSAMAGEKYAACATKDFLSVENWEYECPTCGFIHKRSRRYTEAQAFVRGCPRCKTRLTMFQVTRINK